MSTINRESPGFRIPKEALAVGGAFALAFAALKGKNIQPVRLPNRPSSGPQIPPTPTIESHGRMPLEHETKIALAIKILIDNFGDAEAAAKALSENGFDMMILAQITQTYREVADGYFTTAGELQRVMEQVPIEKLEPFIEAVIEVMIQAMTQELPDQRVGKMIAQAPLQEKENSYSKNSLRSIVEQTMLGS